MASITINGNTINPEAPEHVSSDASSSNFVYLQGHADLSIEQKVLLAEMGVNIQEYVAEYTYLCRYRPSDLERLRALPFVAAANVYDAELKSTVSLKKMIERDADRDKYEIDVILHDRPNVDSQALAPYVAEKAGIDVNELEVLPHKIRLTIAKDKLGDVASLDSVNRIEEVRPKGVYNNLARTILHVDTLTTSFGYQGEGQTICVADTGFDQGLAADSGDVKVHPAFAGRIDHLDSIWLPGDAKDPTGHGTHVCGSIVGSGTFQDPVTHQTLDVIGTAPKAKLMVQSLSRLSEDGLKRWVLKSPPDLTSLFAPAYERGIRIHTNSWGDKWDEKTGQLGYEADATTIDRFIVGRQDFVVLVAAGNDGTAYKHGLSQIGDNSAAKNCITVGATGTTRNNDGQSYTPNTSALIGVTDTADFSSRGPTKSTRDSAGRESRGRIKPDVVAPGVVILSAASRATAADAKLRTAYGICGDSDWMYLSGTSMATPLVAGCVALVREALAEMGKLNPSASLVKALLVNGAVNYSTPKGPGFDYKQGFGRVDIDSSISMIKQSRFIEGGSNFEATKYDVSSLGVLPSSDRRWESAPIPVPAGRNKITVTLAYLDAAGALLQNDVNLIVRAGDQERHGNMVAGDTQFDHTNNVEKVIWTDVPTPSITIVVYAYAFTKFDSRQSFAVAWDVKAA